MSESICEMEEGLRKGYEHKMEGLLLIAESTCTTWIIVVGLASMWHLYIEQQVPIPYLVRQPTCLSLQDLASDLIPG